MPPALCYPPDTAEGPLSLALPLDFAAFCELHYQHYLCYARTRITDRHSAQHAVQAALGGIAMRWPYLLASSDPAAYAWRLLEHRIQHHTDTCGELTDATLLHRAPHRPTPTSPGSPAPPDPPSATGCAPQPARWPPAPQPATIHDRELQRTGSHHGLARAPSCPAHDAREFLRAAGQDAKALVAISVPLEQWPVTLLTMNFDPMLSSPAAAVISVRYRARAPGRAGPVDAEAARALACAGRGRPAPSLRPPTPRTAGAAALQPSGGGVRVPGGGHAEQPSERLHHLASGRSSSLRSISQSPKSCRSTLR